MYPLVYSHPHFHTQNAQTCRPEHVEKEIVAWYNTPQRQTSESSDLLRENKLPFWVAQRRTGRQEKMVLSAESRESVLGKKWTWLSQRCGLIMPTSVLPISRWGGNWSVRPLGALRVYDFSCCCHCPGLYWFVKHSFYQRQTADQAALPRHGKK